PADIGRCESVPRWHNLPVGGDRLSGFEAELDLLVRARYPLIYLVSWEEPRVDGILEALATRHGKPLVEWTVNRGPRKLGGVRGARELEPVKDPLKALAAIEKLGGPALVVLKDFHGYLDEPRVVRALRELGQQLKDSFATVVLLSPVLRVPVEL